MPEPTSSTSPSLEVAATLHTVAQLLRAVHHLGPDAQRELATLVDELGNALTSTTLSAAEARHLAESTAHLLQALHQQHDEGFLAAARHRLEQAIINTESKAPFAAGVARRLLDALTNLGI